MNMQAVTSRASAALAAIPVVLVNVVAFAGQLAFLRQHLPWGIAGQVLMAAALESVAIYLAAMAHASALANDSALRLRLAAYAFAGVIAVMNYSHYARGWRPTFPAVAVALCSAASPWLWGVYTRRVSRDRLLAAGLVEPHALRLGATRWAWHPAASARVMRAATWTGQTDPVAAIAAASKAPAAPGPPNGGGGKEAGTGPAKRTRSASPAASGAAPSPRPVPARPRGAPRRPAGRPAQEPTGQWQQALDLFTAETAKLPPGKSLSDRQGKALAAAHGLDEITRYRAGFLLRQITNTTDQDAQGDPAVYLAGASNGHGR